MKREGWSNVICVASGPSLSIEQCDLIEAARVAGKVRVIVVNNTWQRLPNADALYACDGKWIAKYGAEVRNGFAGEFWTQDRKYADAPGMHWIRSKGHPGLSRDPLVIHTGGNGGYQSIGLAYHFGARRIILAGFDMSNSSDGRRHWHPDHPHGFGNPRHPETWVPRFTKLADDLAAEGVDVINCSARTALHQFPRADLATTLDNLRAP